MSERKNINIDILASCVCRDAFGIGASAVAGNKYAVKSNFQYNSFLSYMSAPNEKLSAITDEEISFGTPWQKRMLLADFKKDVFSKLYVENSFIILDITSAVLEHFNISESDVSLLTSTKVSRPNMQIIENALGFSPMVINPLDMNEDYINDAIERYTSKIVSLFPKGKIIFTEVFHVTEYLNKNGTLSPFANPAEIKKKNDFLDKLGKKICKRLEELGSPAYVVPMPGGVVGYELHKWGKFSLHYCDEYYEYLFRAYDTICSGYSLEEISEIIAELKSTCESRFAAVRERANIRASFLATLKRLENENKKLKNELKGTRASLSFKIGRFVTFIPRKILRKK